jgi:phosphoribosyl-ATP pyrophosphohydrolase
MAKATKKKPAKWSEAKRGKPKADAALTIPAIVPPPSPTLGVGPAVLDRLWTVVMSRRNADPSVSHSARLLARGTGSIAQKFGEEAVECLIEAVVGNRDKLIAESADVLYHLIVLWVDGGVRPDEVWSELQRREGISGIAEKAARGRALPLCVTSTKIP